jgi:hypothetical protein
VVVTSFLTPECRDRGADFEHVGDAVGSAGVAGSRRV